MTALFTWWWLALPSLLLPLWWHRQRQRQRQVFPLATAKFLEQAEPQTVQVWRWRELLLLLLRLAILGCLIALLAQFLIGQRGDTIFASANADQAWLDEQVAEIKKQNGASSINLIRYCDRIECELQTSTIFAWLEQHQTQWQGNSRWWLLAAEDELAMPAQAPRYSSRVELRLGPSVAEQEKQSLATKGREVTVVLKSGRIDQWRAWFKVFETSSDGRLRFNLTEQWQPNAQLVIWESPLAPREEWRAPLWWISEASAYKAMKAIQDGSSEAKSIVKSVATEADMTSHSSFFTTQGIQQTDAPQGRLWLVGPKDWPLSGTDAGAALQLFQAWQATQSVYEPIPAQAYISLPEPTTKSTSVSIVFAELGLGGIGKELRNRWEDVILAVLVLLLMTERVSQHVSRK